MVSVVALAVGGCANGAGDQESAAPAAPATPPAPSADAAEGVQAAAQPAAPTSQGSTLNTGLAPTSPSPTGPSSANGRAIQAGPARFLQRGPATSGAVALTFHTNGDPALATALLDRLAARRTAITAFVVGNWLSEHPDLGHRMLRDGHELANHSWSHPTMSGLDRQTIADEIQAGAAALAPFLGGPGRWFRPSGMEIASPEVLLEAGLAGYQTVVGYSVDSLDFTDPGAAMVRRNVSEAVGGGDIVSLHFGHPDTLAALDGMLDDLTARGLRPVTVSALLGQPSAATRG